MIKHDLNFRYDGIDSNTMYIKNATLSGGLFEEPFVAEREISEINIKGRANPYFQEIILSPITLDLELVFSKTLDENKINDIKKWLCKDYYKPLIFSDDIKLVNEGTEQNPVMVEKIDKIYYALMVSQPTVFHNGYYQGYCKCRFRCDSPYAYSPVHTTPLTSSPTTINNLGTVICYPKITIVMNGSGNVSIVNTSDNNRTTTIAGLVNGEIVTIDCERKIITTSLALTHRYNNFNDNYLYLKPGNNILTYSGNADVSLQYEFRYL